MCNNGYDLGIERFAPLDAADAFFPSSQPSRNIYGKIFGREQRNSPCRCSITVVMHQNPSVKTDMINRDGTEGQHTKVAKKLYNIKYHFKRLYHIASPPLIDYNRANGYIPIVAYISILVKVYQEEVKRYV